MISDMYEELITLIQNDICLKNHFVIHCYYKWEMYSEKDRQKQIELYEDCIANSEGSERDRYVEVWQQLKNNYKIILDDCDDYRELSYFVKHNKDQVKRIENKVLLGRQV